MPDLNLYTPTDAATAPSGYEKKKSSSKTLADASQVQRTVMVVSTGTDSIAEVSDSAPLPIKVPNGSNVVLGSQNDTEWDGTSVASTAMRYLRRMARSLIAMSDTVQSYDTRTTAGTTTVKKFRRQLTLQVTGTATDVTLQVQRSTQDPAGTANWANVDNISLNPVNTYAENYYEAGACWWRVNVVSINSGNVNISLDGGAA